MAVKLDHTIVNVRDKRESANFFAELFGLAKPTPFGAHLLTVEVANDVTLDFCGADYEVEKRHYAFLVTEKADPAKREKGKINRHDGGRGVYFEEPSGHFLEIITAPYGGWRKK